MKAMLFGSPHTPLREVDGAAPRPGAGEVLLAVRACGVCRTDLHLFDGELEHPHLAPFLCAGLIGAAVVDLRA